MKPEWGRLKAVVLESDDWGLCAWTADDAAHRALAETPMFCSPAGRMYGRSTLESAADVRALVRLLLEFRGADGRPPILQANTVMAAPDFERIAAGEIDGDELPLLLLPELPSRWRRPGLWEQVRAGIDAGVWWPELHGLHHLPARAWLAALRRGDADARGALEEQCVVCSSVVGGGEYDPSESAVVRTRDVERAVAHFTGLFGRAPDSLCPPDYRWDAQLEADARRLGITVLQGTAERADAWLRVRRLVRRRWPDWRGGFLLMPARIAFEPRGNAAPDARLGAARTHVGVRAAWRRGKVAVVSTHRLNYAHLDSEWSEIGRSALRDLLRRLCEDGAVFLTDVKVRELAQSAATPG
jgi:hypothetical protein